MHPFFRRDEIERSIIFGRVLVRLSEMRRRAGLVLVLVHRFGLSQQELAEVFEVDPAQISRDLLWADEKLGPLIEDEAARFDAECDGRRPKPGPSVKQTANGDTPLPRPPKGKR